MSHSLLLVPCLTAAACLLGCDGPLTQALDDARAAIPDVCKDYCESRVYCEWLEAPASGSDEPEAHSDRVRRCVQDCGSYMDAGAWLVKPSPDPRYDREYVGRATGATLAATLTCLNDARVLRCLSSRGSSPDTTTLDIPMPSDIYEGFGLFLATEEECELAALCLKDVPGASLTWEAVTATCALAGDISIEAPFLTAPRRKD